MQTCILLHRLRRSWHSCSWWVSTGNKNTPSIHHPQRRNVTTPMAGLKKVTYAKISPKIVNPRDIAGNTEEKEEESRIVLCRLHENRVVKPDIPQDHLTVFLSWNHTSTSKSKWEDTVQRLKKLENTQTKCLQARCPKSVCTVLEFWHMTDDSHPCTLSSLLQWWQQQPPVTTPAQHTKP